MISGLELTNSQGRLIFPRGQVELNKHSCLLLLWNSIYFFLSICFYCGCSSLKVWGSWRNPFPILHSIRHLCQTATQPMKPKSWFMKTHLYCRQTQFQCWLSSVLGFQFVLAPGNHPFLQAQLSFLKDLCHTLPILFRYLIARQFSYVDQEIAHSIHFQLKHRPFLVCYIGLFFASVLFMGALSVYIRDSSTQGHCRRPFILFEAFFLQTPMAAWGLSLGVEVNLPPSQSNQSARS